MGNYQKKKESAKVHNTTNDIVNNLLYIGTCECSGELFMYLKSKEENIYNIYCSKCENKKDFRQIDKESIRLLFTPSSILNTLIEAYGKDVIEKTYEE
jgi:hypothetical protein